MLPRISSALVKFLSPIASSTHLGAHSELQPEPKEKKSKPTLTVVPTKLDPQIPDSSSPPDVPKTPSDTPQHFNPWIELLSAFQERKKTLLTRSGLETYAKNLRKLKQAKRHRKGIILDRSQD